MTLESQTYGGEPIAPLSEEFFSRDRHLIGQAYFEPAPGHFFALFYCLDSYFEDKDWGEGNFWIAVRLTEDDDAYEFVRMDTFGRIVQQYPGRYENYDHALLEAAALSKVWGQPRNDHLARAAVEERDLTRALKNNPWARAVYERKHPDGPVLVIWHMEPLPLYIASWLPFAGGLCIPSLAAFAVETDPIRAIMVVDNLADKVFELGPSGKMVERAKSIAAAYAANGAKGGRPSRKDAKPSKRK